MSQHALRAALAAVVLLPSSPAVALEFHGAEVSLSVLDSGDLDWNQITFGGAAALTFGPVGAQIGLRRINYTGDTDATATEAHLFYLAGNGLTVGAYAGSESYFFDYDYRGVEVSFRNGPVRLEAFGGTYDGPGLDANTLGIAGHYDFGRFGFGLGTSRFDSDGFSPTHYYLAGSYTVVDNLAIEGRVGRTSGSGADADTVSLGLTWRYAQGVPFGFRNYSAVIPGD
jgi:hypothetical protein